MSRFRSMLLVVFAFGLPLVSNAQAPAYPTKPIRLVVPFAPGGATDTLTRLIAARMASALGQPILVENRAGAGGNIGTEHVAKSAPDGYTILVATPGPMAINVSLVGNLPYEPLRDFDAIGQFIQTQSVIMAGLNQPYRSLGDVVDQARRSPGTLPYATAGVGTSSHLVMELLQSSFGMRMTHVAYKGDAPALNDLLGGVVPLMITNVPGVLPQIKAGRIRALAVAGPRRSPLLPDVPTVAEAGLPGFGVTAWAGLVAPAGTPKVVVARLNAELQRALAVPEVEERVQQTGSEVRTGAPEEFAELLRSENERWPKVIREAGIKNQ